MPLFYIKTKRSLLHKQGLKAKSGVQNHTRPVWGSQRPEGAPRDLSPDGSPSTGSTRSHPQLCLGCWRPGEPPFVGTGGTQDTETPFGDGKVTPFGARERVFGQRSPFWGCTSHPQQQQLSITRGMRAAPSPPSAPLPFTCCRWEIRQVPEPRGRGRPAPAAGLCQGRQGRAQGRRWHGRSPGPAARLGSARLGSGAGAGPGGSAPGSAGGAQGREEEEEEKKKRKLHPAMESCSLWAVPRLPANTPRILVWGAKGKVGAALSWECRGGLGMLSP